MIQSCRHCSGHCPHSLWGCSDLWEEGGGTGYVCMYVLVLMYTFQTFIGAFLLCRGSQIVQNVCNRRLLVCLSTGCVCLVTSPFEGLGRWVGLGLGPFASSGTGSFIYGFGNQLKAMYLYKL